MTDLSDPAIREAGARALWVDPLWRKDADDKAALARLWDTAPDYVRARFFAAWDRLAAELGPIIQQAEIREQLRGRIDDAGTENT